jgi:biopolymer transport protein ExbD
MAADGDVPYRHIITVMDALKSGGVTSVDVQTQPVRVGRAR